MPLPVVGVAGLNAVAEIVKAIIADRASQHKFDLILLHKATPEQRHRYIESIIVREEATTSNIAWWQSKFDQLGAALDGGS